MRLVNLQSPKEETLEDTGHYARDGSSTGSGGSTPHSPSRNITSSKTVTQTFIVSPVPPTSSENSTTSISVDKDQPFTALPDGTTNDEVKSCTRAVIEGRAAPVTIPSSGFAYQPLSSDEVVDAAPTAGSAISQDAQPPLSRTAFPKISSATESKRLPAPTETQEHHNKPPSQSTAEQIQSNIPAKGFPSLSGVNTTTTNSPLSSSPLTQFLTLVTAATATTNPAPTTVTQRNAGNNKLQAVGCKMSSGRIDGQGLDSACVESSTRRTVTLTKRICPMQGF